MSNTDQMTTDINATTVELRGQTKLLGKALDDRFVDHANRLIVGNDRTRNIALMYLGVAVTVVYTLIAVNAPETFATLSSVLYLLASTAITGVMLFITVIYMFTLLTQGIYPKWFLRTKKDVRNEERDNDEKIMLIDETMSYIKTKYNVHINENQAWKIVQVGGKTDEGDDVLILRDGLMEEVSVTVDNGVLILLNTDGRELERAI